jgi:hypothetical protein
MTQEAVPGSMGLCPFWSVEGLEIEQAVSVAGIGVVLLTAT